jgi:hypothetical protein
MLAQNKLIRVRKKAFRQRQKYARGWIWSRQNIFVATIQCHFYCLLISDHIAGGDSRLNTRKKIAWWCLLILIVPHAHSTAAAPPGNQQASAVESAIQVLVDGTAPPLSTFMGLGIEFDPYDNQPAATKWQTILDRVRTMRPGFLRVMSRAGDYCLGFDDKGSPIYVWDHHDPTTQKNLNKLLAILDFAQKEKIDVFLGEWSPPRGIGIESPSDPRWPRIIADFVQYLVRQRHYSVLRHYIFFNEPSGQWMWPHSTPDYGAWSTGIKTLRHELDMRGLQGVSLAGPDNSGDKDWFTSSVRDLSAEIGSWESHIYATDSEVYNGIIESELKQTTSTILNTDPAGGSKERFLAESGLQDGKNGQLDQQPRVRTFIYGVLMADYVAQVARAGWMGADAWDLDDAMHGNGHGGLKVWGFWDSSSGSGMHVRPWFYVWSLMSKLFPAGSQILRVEESPTMPRFRATACSWISAAGDQTSIMLVNDADQARNVRVRMPSVTQSSLCTYHYFKNDRPTGSTGMPKASVGVLKVDSNRSLTINMPSRGVIFLTSAL